MSNGNPNGTIWGNSPGVENPKNPGGLQIRYTSTRGYELLGTGAPVQITPQQARQYQTAWNITPEVQARSMNEESGNRLRRAVAGAPATSTPPATGGGSSSAPAAPPAPTRFANTSTPTQELGPISQLATLELNLTVEVFYRLTVIWLLSRHLEIVQILLY